MSEQHTPPDQAEQAMADLIDDLVPSHGYRKIPLVGLGGSAGSIEALQTFFTTMPLQSGMAFVVIIHLAPDQESHLADVIQRCTSMKVIQVTERIDVKAGEIYVIPPGRMLQTVDSHLQLHHLPAPQARHAAVDIFFRTLADTHGPHAAAVVLSGMDGDGAIGIKRIKERGGLTIAQDPEQADQPSMPRSSIGTGMVDWILPVQDIPARLLGYFRMERAISLPPEDPQSVQAAKAAEGDEQQLRDVLAFLRSRTGRDFTNYKRATVLRRIGRRMQVNGVDNLGAYLNALRTRPGECAALLQDLLISVTNFFRDSECFTALESHIPALFEGKGPQDVIRVWVLACATGEEAFSLGIMLSEYARQLDAPPQFQIFATDLDENAIKTAREGVYPATIEADVTEDRLRRYFQKDPRGYRVRRELRETVLFAVHDVLSNSPFSRLDLVSCRNLLIYLNREAQQRVMETIHFALLPGAKLFLGSSESVDESTLLFDVLDKKNRIYRQRPADRAGVPRPIAPSTLKLSLEPIATAPEPPIISGAAFLPPLAAAIARGGNAGRGQPPGDMHLRLLEMLAAPSVVVNNEYELVHLSPSAGRYLHFSGGEPTRNLLRAVPGSLMLELRAALFQSGQTGEAIELKAATLDADGAKVAVQVKVVPFDEGGQLFFLVSFDNRPEDQVPTPQATSLGPEPLARHLDREIERLKSQLRETVEQYEASTEELKASNEELQAMNEEMRAATEELETSREELQSINEELTTVNQELKSKVEQLSHSNSDMQNLMDATSIATVFLDRDLRIMRYTPAAVGLFNLIQSDLGRPLTDLTTQLDYPELGDDAQQVLQRLVPVEREVGRATGHWYLARLTPYRTAEDRIAGVVFAFIDITARKQAEEMRLWLSAVVTATSDGIISFSLDGTILSWNSGAERLFGYTAHEAIGQSMWLLLDNVHEQEQLTSAVQAGRTVQDLETVRKHKDGSTVPVALTASPVRDDAGRVLAATVIARDISAARASAEALRRSEERLRMVVENVVEYAIYTTDPDLKVTMWNRGAERILGYTEAEIMGQGSEIIFTPEDRASQAPEKEAQTAREHGRSADERHHMRKGGKRFPGSGVLMLMRDQDGKEAGFVKVLRDLSAPLPKPEA